MAQQGTADVLFPTPGAGVRLERPSAVAPAVWLGRSGTGVSVSGPPPFARSAREAASIHVSHPPASAPLATE
ncbi:hypothetical protein DVH02_17705 [Streptomyces corynorhini]|uniref:Uncharacterized protein n=1 Tax=Streptomyces corynorhini TaxID=2282652 RepID=A0A370BAY4_9ACTN|nr:hypothetical protein DVH02_17705 [Streptomyces corynorhini]